MKKELVKKETNEVVAVDFDMSLLGDLPSAEASDYKIPALLLVQPTSKVAGNAGEIIDGGSGQVLTTVNKKLEFVPLWFWKTWKRTLITPKNERKNLPSEQVTASNMHYRQEREVVVEGGIEKREECTNVFMMLPKDLGSPMPTLYVFRFKGMAQPEAKKLLTFWTNAKNYKQIPFSYVFSMTPSLITNEKGKFYIPTISNEVEGDAYKKISGPALQIVADWVSIIAKNVTAMTGQVEKKLDDAEGSEYTPSGTEKVSVEEFSNQF